MVGAMKGGLLLGKDMGLEVSLFGVRGHRVTCELGRGYGQSQQKGRCSS